MRPRKRLALYTPIFFLALTSVAQKTTVPKADGTPLAVTSDVSSSVSVEAVLLPPSVAKRIFGGEVANHYAVVQMVISNHSNESSLILQSAFLDYRHWLFSNNFQLPGADNNDVNPFSYQKADLANQVASTEARLVRGDLQDAQVWTWRNAFIRAATTVGTIASGYSFLAAGNYVKGISAYGNDVVPALGLLWPDLSQLQINRVSDFGFQTNHVIAKSSSDIVVAFFPIDRFLIPSLRKIYLKSPAVFFVPGEMLVDKKYKKILGHMLLDSGADSKAKTADEAAADATVALSHYELLKSCLATQAAAKNPPPENKEKSTPDSMAIAEEQSCLTPTDSIILSFLKEVSLNNIRLVVGGIMSVDTNTVPAQIDSLTFTDAEKPATWKKGVKVTATIAGSFLTNGTVAFAPATADAPATTDVEKPTVVIKDSTDKKLVFTFDLTADIPTATPIKITVTKTAVDGSTTTSKPFTQMVTYTPLPAKADAPVPATKPDAKPVTLAPDSKPTEVKPKKL